MRKKISRKERLLAVSLTFVMVITSLSSSFAMALSGTVTSATQAVIQAGSINWGFTLKDENSKTYTATCMEPHNQSIPSAGNKVNLTAFSRSSTQAWIAYLGKDRHTSDKKKQQYVIARAAARRAGNVDKNNYEYYTEVNDLYDDAKAKADAGKTVPSDFRVYKADPNNGSQDMIAWRYLDETKIKLKKSPEEPTSFSLAGAKYGVYSSKANAKADTCRLATLTTKADGTTNVYSTYFVGKKTFYVKEVSAPDGFELDETVYSKTVKEGQAVTFSSEEPLESTGGARVVKTTDIETIPEGYDLAGAVYGLYKTKANANADKNREGTMKTKANGTSNIISGLEPGTYYVKEVSCPSWLELDTAVHTVTVKVDTTAKVYSEDIAKKSKAAVQKSTNVPVPAGKSLAGAQYGVYVDHDAAEEGADDPTLRVGILTTQEDGHTGMLELPPGEYCIKEISCPSWLEMDETIYDVTLEPGEEETVYSEDPLKLGKLKLKKKINLSEVPEGLSIAGAQYGVYDTYADAAANSTTGRISTLTTDAAGETNTVILDPGKTYYVREYDCPQWLKLDETIYPAEIVYGQTEVLIVESMDEVNQGHLTLVKKSSVTPPPYSLEGAAYGVYASEADAKANTGKLHTLVTKADGTTNVVEVAPGKTYYIKEYKAPKNYELNPEIQSKSVPYGDGATVTFVSTDTPYGSAKVLKSAAKDPFVLTECPQQYSLAGAEYGIYTTELGADGDDATKKVATLITKENGESNAVHLPSGTYWIIETKASPGFYKDGQPPAKIVVEPGKPVEHTSKEIPMFDPITIVLDKEPGNDKANKPSLAGAEFKVEYYTKVAADISDLGSETPKRTWYFETKLEAGKGVIGYRDDYKVSGKGDELFKDGNGIPVGLIGSYVITETRAPKGYIIDPDPILTNIHNTGTLTNPQVSYTNRTNVNDPKEFRLKLVKQDSETGNTAQGDATLEGAVFGLYRDGVLVEQFTTGSDFTFTTPYYNIGDGSQKYTLKEISPPEGYTPHTTVYNLSELDGNTITVQYTTVDRTIKNDVIKGKVALTKLLSSKRFPDLMKPEEGVTLEVYLTSAGSYAAAKDSEKQTITTDADGYAETKSLPYGVYTVHQVNTTTGYEMIPDFEVVISEHNKTYRYTLNDKEYEADLRVTKADSETGKVIPVSGATFKVRKAGTGEWLSFKVKYPTVQTVTEFVTDESGTFQLPESIPYGSYELVEIAAPSGYLFSDAPIPFTVDGSKSIIELTVENDPQKGVIEVVKTGEVLKSVTANADGTYTPVFEEAPIKDAVFEIFAKTDIVTPDGTRKYSAGEKVDTVTTNASGTATSKALYLGQYEVKEVTAGENHVLNTKVFDAELTYDAGKVQVKDTVAVKNDRQKASVTLKKNLETDSLFKYGNDKHKDIVFGIYADEIITAENGTSIPKGGLIQAIGVSEDGSAYSGSFTCDLPHGSFYVKEMETAEGYILGDTKYDVTFDYKDQTVKTVNIAVNNGNAIDNNIMRSDIEGLKVSESDVKLSGALIGLFWEGETDFTESNAILTDTSDENGAFAFKDVAYGKYIVREIRQPAGYVLSETSYPVNVDRDGKVIPVKVQNEVTKFDIAKTDIATGDYVVGAQLSIIPLDEDGNPDVGATFETWITDDKEHRVEGLEVGKTYILREKLTGKAWDYGYVTAEDIKFTVPDTGKVQKIEMKNDFTKVDIAKTDIVTGDYVVGAQLTIYPVNALGFPKLGEAFETWITEDKEHRVEHLPVGDYILRETLTGEAWDYGYVTAEDVKFTVSDTGVVQKVEMKDDFTKVDIAKTDIVTGDYVIGTQLAIIPLDEHGNPDVGATFETWITEDKEHHVERIPVGDYILRETLTGKAWDYGYVTADDVKFTVSDTPDVQKVEMKDDFTKLEVTKTNIMTGEPVVGTQLSLIPLDEDGNPDIGATFDTWITDGTPHYIERIPVGEYILREKLTGQAWNYGYVTAEDVIFTVEDTPEIQKVDMDDDYTKVEITKTDITTGEPVVGTQLSLIPLDENGEPKAGETFDTWITDDKAHYMEYVPVGEYIVRETLSGEAWDYGYVTAEDLVITVKDTAEVQKFDMDDDYTKLEITKTDITTRKPVIGAQLAIIPLDENGNPDIGATFDTWLTDENPHYIERIPVGEYILREVLAGAADYGYVTAEDVKFTVKDTGEIQKVEMKDDYTKLEITKADSVTNAGIPNTELSLYPVNDKGEVSEKAFVTATTDKDGKLYVEYIPVGEYVLRETGTNFGAGYVTAQDIRLKVMDTGLVQSVTMKDDHTKVEIKKTDIETGEQIAGATLQILKPDGTLVTEFESTDAAFETTYLPVGDYILRETNAPVGYVKAVDMKFTVADTAEIQTFEMKDDYIKVSILKKDAENQKVLPGAELLLLDENEKVITAWTSGKEAKQFDRLPAGTYTLREAKAPAGYEVAVPVTFEVKETSDIQEIVMLDDKSVVSKAEKKTEIPDTGDANHPLGWMAVAVLGIGGLIAGLRRKRR